MSEPLHVLVIPSWYPQSEQDVDGIFFQNQALALQRKGIKTAVLAPMFRYLRKETASILTGLTVLQNIGKAVWTSMHGTACISSPAFRSSTSTASAGCVRV
ncbi:TPA: glycosyl transferase group 1 [Neisseria meningitidis]